MQQDNFQLLDVQSVQRLTSMSKTSIYTIHDFPKPVKIDGEKAKMQGGSRWIEAEVIAWIESRIVLRDAKKAAAK